VIQFECVSNGIMTESSGGNTTTLPIDWVTTFVENQWYQIALTYSSSNVACYVNGALIGTGIWPSQDGSGLYETGYGMFVWPTIGTATPFCIGNDTTSTNIMNGEMDELETFNYPLSAQAIAYGFATFNGCSTNNMQDTDYVGRSDVLRTLASRGSFRRRRTGLPWPPAGAVGR
jgi:hypothetical protein